MTRSIVFLHLILFGGVLSTTLRTEEPSTSGDLPVGVNAANVMLSTFESDPDFRRPSQEHAHDLPHDADFTPSPLWNENVWPPPKSSNAEPFDLPVKRAARDFIRLGRARSNSYMRLGRDSGFIRFGRSNGGNLPSSSGNNIGRRDSGFLRFGRANGENALQYGGLGDLVDDSMRFGRRGDKFIRFGRSQAPSRTNTDSYYGNSIDRDGGKRYEDVIGGKSARAQNFIRLGRARANDNSFIRLGRTFSDDADQPWVESTAMKNSLVDADDGAPATAVESDESTARLANDNDFSSEK